MKIRSPIDSWTNSLKAVVLGGAVGTGFGIAAFLFLNSRHEGMGEVLFVLVPIAAGFSIAMISRGASSAAAAAFLAVLCSLTILIATGKEGGLCAALAFPIILAGLAIGLVIGIAVGALLRWLSLDRRENQTTTMGVLLVTIPLMILAGDQVERPLLEHPRIDVIQNSITVNVPPVRVWEDILSIDNVQASKPLLMYIGLPIPERCTLQGQGVGAKRTCYFNSGYIEETITGWNPPYYMGLTIDRTHMPGRHWLGFESAEYRLQGNGTSTILTRTTTISSHLLPRWYWRPLERLGVESEHRYILQDVVMKTATHSLR